MFKEIRISKLINLKNKIVAVVQADELPPKFLQFQKGKWGCAVAMLAAAANGKVAEFSEETATCTGSRAGLGFQKYPLG